jgi:hypothetical protein
MLPLRLGIVAGIFGVALSGLFQLLDNLSEPELLRSKKAIIVKGCNPIEGEDAARLCPQLFCQKFLLDSRVVELRARFEVTVDERVGAEQVIGGVATISEVTENFACLLENSKVTAGRVLQAAEFEQLVQQPESASQTLTLPSP